MNTIDRDSDELESFRPRSGASRGTAILAALVAAAVFAGIAPAGSPKLDTPGQNACYRFFRFLEDATTMTPAEMHSALKAVYFGEGGFGGFGAKRSTNAIIRRQARRLL